MYLKLDKIKEDAESVWYTFFTEVGGEPYINEKGLRRLHLVEKRGVCRFNKMTESFFVDWNQTDDYFKESSSEVVMIQYKIMKYNKSKHFPEMFEIATG